MENISKLPETVEVPPVTEENMVLAMAYVKRQAWGELYDDETALSRGTIFPALDLPFKGEGGGSAR